MLPCKTNLQHYAILMCNIYVKIHGTEHKKEHGKEHKKQLKKMHEKERESGGMRRGERNRENYTHMLTDRQIGRQTVSKPLEKTKS